MIAGAKRFFSISAVFLLSFTSAQVVINEVLFHPICPEANQEFVEILNVGDSAIDLSGWRIADNNAVDDLFPDNPVLNPGEYAVILEADYEDCFETVFPDEVNLIYVDDNSIGNGLGNSGDMLFLISSPGDTVSEVTWSGGVTPGHSIEKVVSDYPDIPENWRESLEQLGTPGRPNSVAGQVVDVALDSLWVMPQSPETNEPFTVFARVMNIGLVDVTAAVFCNGEELLSVPLPIGLTREAELIQDDLPPGYYGYVCAAVTEGDYNGSNDSLSLYLRMEFPYRTLIINEIMYDPLPEASEWVEIMNVSGDTVNLKYWFINDEEVYSADGIVIDHWIPPGGFSVISSGQTDGQWVIQDGFPTLNNTGDYVFLFDLTGKMIDHVSYSSDWGGENGFSLERITRHLDSNNPQNWGTCILPSGGTPGVENSLYAKEVSNGTGIILQPNPFSPDDDGYEDELMIAYRLPFSYAEIRLTILDSAGRSVRELKKGEPTGKEGVVRWDGKNDKGGICRTGQYILLLEARSAWSSQVWKITERIVLVRRF